MIDFNDFVTCFRKQFLLQKGHGGRRISAYYTNYNQEQQLKNDEWGIMVFIYTGGLLGFTDKQMRKELNISKELYEQLKVGAKMAVLPSYPDKRLQSRVLTKVGLVKNVVRFNMVYGRL